MIDKGLGPRGWEDVLETSGDYIDIVKLGWGTAFVTPNLRAKLDVLRGQARRHRRDVLRGRLRAGQARRVQALAHRSSASRTSRSPTASIDLPRERKLELIEEFARDFTVLSEVGSKDSDVEFTPEEWTTWLREELDAGAWKVITEAREGGTAGIFSKSGDMRTDLVGEIASGVPLEDVVFEAPTKAAQAWFIKEFGPAVNLGNIAPDEVIPARDAPPRPSRRHAEGGAPWRPRRHSSFLTSRR